MKRKISSMILLASVLLCACRKESADSPAPGATEPAVLTVYTVNYPLQYFAERIGGEHVQVHCPAPAGEDPAYWTPDAEIILAFQKADLILLNGAGYAKWVDKASLPAAKRVNTSAAFEKRYIYLEEALTHSHGPGGAHEHGTVAFTTWLDPGLAGAQAQAIAEALAQAKPSQAAFFQSHLTALLRDLQGLDQRLVEMTTRNKEVPLIFSHPVYQYLARAYGLKSQSVHWEPDELPTEAMWRELTERLADHPARWMIWEGEPDSASVEKLAALGIGSVTFLPCGTQPESGDYLSVMNENLIRLEAVFNGNGT
jgi:zinc transport system substrate-binding protein